MINFEWKNEIDKFIRSTFSGGNTRNFSEIWWQYQTCFWCQHHKHFWWWYHIALCLASNTHSSQSGWKLVTGELLVWAHSDLFSISTHSLSSQNMHSHFRSQSLSSPHEFTFELLVMSSVHEQKSYCWWVREEAVEQSRHSQSKEFSRRPGCVTRT